MYIISLTLLILLFPILKQHLSRFNPPPHPYYHLIPYIIINTHPVTYPDTANDIANDTANGTANDTANGTANGIANRIANGIANGIANKR
jgi:hypothetical protein